MLHRTAVGAQSETVNATGTPLHDTVVANSKQIGRFVD